MISIIMPVYNTPIDSLKRMIDSIVAQSSKEYRLFVVDDGSKNDYASQLDDILAGYENITVFHKPNGGVSSARNYALKHVDTEYVIFVDGDDKISKDYIKKAEEYCGKYNPDIVFGVMEFVPSKKKIQSGKKVEVFEKKDIIEVKRSLLNLYSNKLGYSILGTPCARVYRTKLAQKVMFRADISFMEDQIFNREMLNISNKVIVVPDVWYYYYQNEFSAIHKKLYEDLISNRKAFWKASYELNKLENKSLLSDIRVENLNELYYWISLEIKNNKTPRKTLVKKMAKVTRYPIFREAIEKTKIQSNQLNLKGKISLFLIKWKMYSLFYYVKKQTVK